MTSKTPGQALPLAINLKRTFENAIRDIYEAGLTGKASCYRTPIIQQIRTTAPESSANAQKRALSDAAKALAQLWKVSHNPSR